MMAAMSTPASDATVLVTGGTGLLGRVVVHRLRAAGCQVRVLTRNPSRATAVAGAELFPGDLRDPASLRRALSFAQVVVHCASDIQSAHDVDVSGTLSLIKAMRDLEVGHLVYVSIVGVDRLPIRYYRAKRDVEAIIQSHGVPWTIQRTTQFHPFIETMLSRSARFPLIACPRGLRYQPIAVEEVADRLVHHVGAGPVGMAEDLGGPEVLPVRALASSWLSTTGRRRLLLPVPFPGALGRQFRAGANLCPGQASAGLTWQQYLDQAHLVQAAGR
jgi:uncharacterized protein YbjT (DUF2867 family)